MTARDQTPLQAIGEPGALGRATLGGFAWLMAQSVGSRLIGVVSQIILAWILAPADFGAVALAYTVTALAGQLVNFGVDEVLLQRQRTLRYWTATAFWISLSLSLVGMLAVFAAAPIGAHLYHNPNLVGLLLVLGISMPLGALSTVPNVKLRAIMDFRFLATYATAELFAFQGLTILLALMGLGAYSFVLPAPIFAAIKAVLFWRRAPSVVIGKLRASQVRYMGGRGLEVFGSRLLTEARSQGDVIILGLLAPNAVVGLYYFAFRIAAQPVRMLAGNFSSVLLPALSQLRTDPERQTAAAMRAARVLAYLVMPYCFLQGAIADPGLKLLFGAKWLGAIPLIQVLSVGLAFDAISWIAGTLLNARGSFRLHLVYSLIFSPMFVVVVALGGLLGQAVGVAAAGTAFFILLQPVYVALVFGLQRRRLYELADLYVLPFALAAATIGLAYGLSFLPGIRRYEILRLLVIGALGIPAYVGLMWLVRRDISIELIQRLHLDRLLARLLPPRALLTSQSRPETLS